MIQGLNHITIAVSDLDHSLHFYLDLLGLKGHVRWESGAYLSAGNLWLCLAKGQVAPSKDYTHIAFDVAESNFTELCEQLKLKDIREWKSNKSEGNSLYIFDPDGHKLEIHVGDLASRLNSLREKPYKGLVWL